MPQSQSSVGRAQMKYVPSHPKGTSISPKVLHNHLFLHRQAREARLWVEVEDKAHRLGLQGLRGVSTPSYCRLRLWIIQSLQVMF